MPRLGAIVASGSWGRDGVGGLITANELRRRLDPNDRVVVVERDPQHLFQPTPQRPVVPDGRGA